MSRFIIIQNIYSLKPKPTRHCSSLEILSDTLVAAPVVKVINCMALFTLSKA
jgi:hypothetical protein